MPPDPTDPAVPAARTAAAALAEPAVLVRREGALGRITLNRPKAINALTTGMVQTIDAALRTWAADDGIAAVLVDGAGGRGLCAGGDIRFFHDCARRGDPAPKAFWAAEYRLNALISTYPKPYVALMDGLVMGGGIGISAHGATRIVTERSVLSMPEVGIGFVPDVGGTHLLARIPGEIGTHLALTGARIGAADAIACGLADHHLPSDALPAFVAALREAAPPARGTAAAGLGAGGAGPLARRYATVAAATGPSSLAADRAWIDPCYRHGSVEEILAALTASPAPAARAAAEEIAAKSPTSLKVTLRALRSARALPGLGACLDQEYRIACVLLSTHDLVEGIRAAVVDKDRSPRWSPARLDDVTTEDVDRFFAPLGDAELGLGDAGGIGPTDDSGPGGELGLREREAAR
ncbi:enoyl-CoA hydratase/isomerase family protein [Frankia sp. Mgl5]|uniref:enoyl-CoA hydratase/isomerase family protein n=1 Tax=Frankia sp. Mgl5 TaxID=2933793 RepID=UPI002010BD3B|nr:enoyl-CoA hydratase/isomerase family protein [Frankia sp. Mgl5]MCK9932803.1 enoyl-CoA hydratase/isomerase family protein [Frankia sp. Mgl5]